MQWQKAFSLPWIDDAKNFWRFATPAEQLQLLSVGWAKAGFERSGISSPALVAGDADLNGVPDLLVVLVNMNRTCALYSTRALQPSALSHAVPRSLLCCLSAWSALEWRPLRVPCTVYRAQRIILSVRLGTNGACSSCRRMTEARTLCRSSTRSLHETNRPVSNLRWRVFWPLHSTT